MNKTTLCILLVACLLAFQGCAIKKEPAIPAMRGDDAAMQTDMAPAETYPDSAERFNRGVFKFNDGIITKLFKPVNMVYIGFFPQDIRNGFGNFFRNLAYPIRLVNSALQLKFDKVGKETASFALNTVFGVGGLFNVTRNMESLQNSPEDFGQTLAFYGAGSGSYLVLPLLGSTTARDAVGLVADTLLNPVTWVQPPAASFALGTHDRFNTLSAQLPAYESIKEESFDHYTSIKDIYFQSRQSLEKD